MRSLPVYFVTLLNMLLATPASALEIKELMEVHGTCQYFMINDRNVACEDILHHMEYQDGRIGFMFSSPDGKTAVVAFYGQGKSQIAIDADSRISPVGTTFYNMKSARAFGECYFENPYGGHPAVIECSARSARGNSFKARFVTNGTPPVSDSFVDRFNKQ